ncbi:dihydrolipoyl dehydrogenase family protein [Paracoccus sp. (in: a-proteobacteria)]|uniref:dihydrolipoyl dehydrogenase family protein n=1 Tax=Paracoccus sp. TaxID=267 RepID=UPI003A4C6647
MNNDVEKSDATNGASVYAPVSHWDIAVLGGGPGGYTAAFRAADLGRSVVMIDSRPTLGGVCLNVGCIPSKALLHAAKVVTEAQEMAEYGLPFGYAAPDINALRNWKQSVVERLTGGLGLLARKRGVTVLQGVGRLSGPNTLAVVGPDGESSISFDQCIIAVGSEPVTLPIMPPDDPRIINSTSALELSEVPKRLLVLGAGIIGLEMATVYDALGSDVEIVEMQDQIMPGADKDIVKPLKDRISQRYRAVRLRARVTAVDAQKKTINVSLVDGDGTKSSQHFDRILVSVGRRPNGGKICAETAGLDVSADGFIPVSSRSARQPATHLCHWRCCGAAHARPQGGS